MRIRVTQADQDITVTLVVMDCAQCGVVFAISDRLNTSRKESGESFYCPNGHGMTYGKSVADRLRDQLSAAERDREWFRTAERETREERDRVRASLAATKGVVTKMRKRAIAGSCQFCHRHFSNVERHVASRHPGERPHD